MIGTIVAVGVAAAISLTTPAVGAQETPAPAGEVDISVDGGVPLADFELVSPGVMRSGSFTVVNGGAAPVVLQLRAVDIVEREDGCDTDEAKVDPTCAAADGAGELGDGAVFAVWDADSTGPPTFAGSIYELQAVPLDAGSLAPGQSRTFRFDYGLPDQVGNDTQGDQLAFDIEVTYQQRGAAVGGVIVERLPGSRLPATGRDIGRLIELAGVALLSGACLGLLVRAERRRRSAGGERA